MMRRKGKFLVALVAFALMLFLTSCGEDKCQHSWVYDENGSKPATCQEDGYKRKYCSKCNEQTDEIVESTGTEHKVVEDSSLDEMNAEEKAKAKCGSQYNVYGKCQYCKETQVLTQNYKAEHKFETYTTKFEQIIVDDGSINTQKHNKTAGYACNICGLFSSDAETVSEDHNSNKKNENNTNKALELGLCEYFEYVCDCGYEFSNKVEHSWEGVVLKEPTCTEDGIMKYTCSNVDCLVKTKNEVINKLGHDFNEEEKEMDCISRKCKRCEQTITPTADHHFEYDFDCCERICTKCHDLIVPASAIHQYKDTFPCHDRYCMICNSEYSKKGATTEHEFESVAHERLDCTNKEEQYAMHCLVCGDDVYKTFETSYNSHDREVEVEVDPTCLEDGYKIIGCKRCGYEEKTVLQALGHNYGGDVATCHDRACIVCEHVEPYTTEHQLASDGTRCLACGDVIKLSKPIIYYDVPSDSLKVQGESKYIQYYLVNPDDSRTPFNGNMSSYPVGVYSVCAKNIDVTNYLLESEESDILTVWVLKDNPLVSVEQYVNQTRTYLKVHLNANTANVPYYLHVEYYDGDKKLGEKDFRNYKDGGLIGYADMGNVTKVVITLIPPSDLNGNYVYDGIYTIEYIIPTE